LAKSSIGVKAPQTSTAGRNGVRLNGCLYVAVYGQGHIAVLGSDGTVVERIATKGAKPTNLAFGARAKGKIYVTEDEYGVLEAIDVDTDGLPLYR